jgi:hypothetical protein
LRGIAQRNKPTLFNLFLYQNGDTMNAKMTTIVSTVIAVLVMVMTPSTTNAQEKKEAVPQGDIRNDGIPQSDYQAQKKKERAELSKSRTKAEKRFESTRKSYGAGIYTPNYSPVYPYYSPIYPYYSNRRFNRNCRNFWSVRVIRVQVNPTVIRCTPTF